MGLLRRLERHVLVGDLPRPVGVLGARDPARARLRQQPRRSAACSRSRPTSTSTPTPSWSCGRTATRPPTPRPGSPPTTRRRSRTLGAQHGGDQRLHARAGERPLHRRRHDRRLAVGRPQDLRPTRSRCTRASASGGGFYPPDEVIAARDEPQPRGRAAAARGRRLPVPGDRQAGQYCGAGDADRLHRHLRDRRPAGRRTPPAPTPRPPGAGERGDPAATNSSGAKQLGTTTSGTLRPRDRAPPRAPAPATSTSTAARRAIRSPAITLPGSGDARRWRSAGTSRTARTRRRRTSSACAWSTRAGRRRRSSSSSARRRTATAPGRPRTANLTAFAGQTVRIRIEAADASTASLVEAGVDDVRMTHG